MKFKVDEKVFKLLPDYKVACLVIKGLDNTKPSNSEVDMSFAYLSHNSVKTRRDFDLNPEMHSDVTQKWESAMKKLGIDTKEVHPSFVALNNRICLDRSVIPNINPLINTLNAESIKNATPLGAHDLDKVSGYLAVTFNTNGLSFVQMNTGKIIEVNEDEVVYADEKDVLTRNWIWKQSDKDKITEQSQNVFIPIDIIGFSNEEINNLVSEILSGINAFVKYSSATMEIVDAMNPEVDLMNMNELSNVHEVAFVETGVKLDKKLIDQILNKAVENILPSKERLEELLVSGIRIKLYQGFDPTADTLHIGHSVMMRKLEDFRKLGHKVFMLIGDFTGRIGDPSDKTSARQKLTAEKVADNLKLYTQQAAPILGINDSENPVEVVYNNDWLGKLNFSEVVELASHFTVQQMLKRDMFQKRLEEDRPIYLHEFLYPLMQGYDSVVLDVDLEVGGNDQLFNLLAGRTLMQDIKHKDKFVLAGKLLTTSDGRKMGKSEGNMIKLSDSAVDIYGKIMAFPDGFIVPSYELLTSAGLDEIDAIKKELESGTNPIELKKRLAMRLTTELKGDTEAQSAQKYFEEVFQNKSYDEVEIPVVNVHEDELSLLQLLTEITHFAKSNGEARRLVEQGAVKINDVKVTSIQDNINLNEEVILRAGKKVCKIAKV